MAMVARGMKKGWLKEDYAPECNISWGCGQTGFSEQMVCEILLEALTPIISTIQNDSERFPAAGTYAPPFFQPGINPRKCPTRQEDMADLVTYDISRWNIFAIIIGFLQATQLVSQCCHGGSRLYYAPDILFPPSI